MTLGGRSFILNEWINKKKKTRIKDKNFLFGSGGNTTTSTHSKTSSKKPANIT